MHKQIFISTKLSIFLIFISSSSKVLSEMARRDFSITLLSANDLPNVRNFGSISAKVSLQVGQTPVDTLHGTYPQWNASDSTFKYTLKQSTFQEGNIILVIKLYCQRILGDRYIGHVDVNLKTLSDVWHADKPLLMTVLDESNSETQGKIQISYALQGLPGVEGKKDGQSFLGALVERSAVTLLAEGVKTAVLAMLGA